MDQQTSHLSGFMQDGAHILPIRVYYEDTDFWLSTLSVQATPC
jgi:hypothetical protein